MNRLLIPLIFIILCSCNFKQKRNQEKNYQSLSHETIKSENYVRYLAVQGKKLKSVEQKLLDYGQLPSLGNQYIYKFLKATIGEWTLVKFPSDFKDYYSYHNIVYWLLGFPPEDTNYADYVIGISISKSEEPNYLIFNDNYLKNKLELQDDLIGVFENNEKFILSIPFDTFRIVENSKIIDFEKFVEKKQLDFNSIVNNEINYNEFEVLFNEK